MRGYCIFIHRLLFVCSGLCLFPASAEIQSDHLKVITSANPESNAIQSFVIIKEGQFLKEGIGKGYPPRTIGQQVPFVVEYTGPLTSAQSVSWQVTIPNKQHGTLNILSRIKGKGRTLKTSYTWHSEQLANNVSERHKLIFRPRPFSHQPAIYKKGKGPKGERRRYGGGTRNIDEKKYNPQITYDVILSISEGGQKIEEHRAILRMDYKDMIRQEYINH